MKGGDHKKKIELLVDELGIKKVVEILPLIKNQAFQDLLTIMILERGGIETDLTFVDRMHKLLSEMQELVSPTKKKQASPAKKK